MRKLVRFSRDIWSLAKPYFVSEERGFAISMVLALLALSLITVGLGIVISYSQAIFFTALQRKDPAGFFRGLFWFTSRETGLPMPPFAVLAGINIGLNALSFYLQGWLQIRWQRWLTAQLLGAWLSGRTAFVLSLTQSAASRIADNPDQRIQEDIEDFTRNSILFTFGLLTSVSTVLSYSALLWTLSGAIRIAGIKVPGYLLWAAFLYAIVATWLTHRTGARLSDLNFVHQRLRGDFRHGLTRVRDQIEEITLLRGQQAERRALESRFDAFAANTMRIVGASARVTFLSLGFDQAAIVFPTAIAAPSFFSGAITFGTLNQIRLGFLQMAEAMLWFVSSYTALAAYVAQVERLRSFGQAVTAARTTPSPIAAPETPGETLEASLQVETPTQRRLLTISRLTLTPGGATAIMAPSGSGKSSLLRALAGVWPFGSGEVRRPDGEALFLPQRPYIPDGTLRDALGYPGAAEAVQDGEVREALEAAGLEALGTELDIAMPWSQRLSLGEQQRLSFARVLLLRPAWVFMDEPTASLEDEAQIALFTRLRQRLPRAAILSVTHRELFARLHDAILTIDAEGRLVPSDRVA